MRTSVKTLAASSIVAASLLVAPAAFADTNDGSTATATVDSGTLDVTASDVTLGAVTTAHTPQPAAGTLTVGVSDTTGTGDGWNVTQSVSDFTYAGGGNDGATIAATNFSVTSVGTVTSTAGDPANTVTAGLVGSLAGEHRVLSAAADGGEGAYSAPVNVELTIPAESRAGSYTATLTTTITPAIN